MCGDILHVMHEITAQDNLLGGCGAAGPWQGMNSPLNQGLSSISTTNCVPGIHSCVVHELSCAIRRTQLCFSVLTSFQLSISAVL